MKKGYWMGMVNVTDPENYPKYIAANAAAFQKYGAKFLVRGGQGPTSKRRRQPSRHHRVRELRDGARLLQFAGIPGSAEDAPAYSTAHFAIVEGA